MKELVPLLEKLADKLGVTAEYIFGVFTRQALYAGITDIIQYLLLGVAVYFWWTKREKVWKMIDDPFLPAFCWIMTGFALGCLLILAFLCIPGTIKAFINPECWALEQLFKALGGLK